MKDFRRAVDTSLTRYLPNGTMTVGISHSGENDYISRGVSLLATRATEDKNTTWTAGVGLNRDVINPSNRIVFNETKRGTDFILGVTQVMSMNDIVQVNLGYFNGRGYFPILTKFTTKDPATVRMKLCKRVGITISVNSMARHA